MELHKHVSKEKPWPSRLGLESSQAGRSASPTLIRMPKQTRPPFSGLTRTPADYLHLTPVITAMIEWSTAMR